jgi:hypothetical protein
MQWMPAHPLLLAARDGDDLCSRRGVAIPWNTYGSTSSGRIKARRGSVRLAEQLREIKLLAGHRKPGEPDPEPVGYVTSATDTETGLELVLHFASTPAGDAALLEADEGVRDALSVELDEVEMEGDELVASELVAVSLIPIPAFSSARLAAELATHIQEGPTTVTIQAPEPPVIEAPPAIQASLPSEHSRTMGAPPPRTVAELAHTMQQIATGHGGPELRAALADITLTANVWVQQPQYVGELWNGVAYEREIIPLLTTASLTSMTIKGWRWKVAPVVAPYAGDKAAVPTNPAVTEAHEVDAERLAGAHDIDRKFRDFNDTAFFESYYRAMTESYARQSDAAALAALLAAAPSVAPESGTPSAWDNVLAVWAKVFSAPNSGRPTFVLVGIDVAMALAKVALNESPASLALVGFTPELIRPTPLLPPAEILAGVKAGASYYELPGSPIRVEAVNLPNGGIDAGVFGYYGVDVHAAQAFAKMDTSVVTP